jgi:hypothetical protein
MILDFLKRKRKFIAEELFTGEKLLEGGIESERWLKWRVRNGVDFSKRKGVFGFGLYWD